MAALTEAEKVAVRRHCGYPLFGGQPVQAFGYRFMTHYGTLEFRMENMQDEEATVVRGFLTKLAAFEEAEASVSDNLDTAAAAVWTRNPNEHADRQRLYDSWVKKLLGFFGIPRGPALSGNSRNVSLVV